MRRLIRLFLFLGLIFVASCTEVGSRLPLPFPTPAQHDLVVLIQPGPLTQTEDDNGNPGGLERDLIEAFAQELGVGVKYEVAEASRFAERLVGTRYHIAAGWMSPVGHSPLQTSEPIFQSQDWIAQHEASLPLGELADLAGKTVHVIAGSRQALSLKQLQAQVPELKIAEVDSGDVLGLLESLGERRVSYVAIDGYLKDLANQFVPNLRTSLGIGAEHPIVWSLGTNPNPELRAKANAFIQRVQRDGTLARLEDRYFGHLRRLSQADIVKFLGEVELTLPKYRRYFQAAQALTGLDWRLIAAVAYHESHWDPNATSYTNVRGIMMLTEDTADRLEIDNRLDPAQSILGGARYINLLKDQLPPEVEEPDRTWQALAAYNIGPGHFSAARALARQLKADPNAWYELKQVLPKLSQAKYAQQFKTGRARGGEAVILVENIRSYYNILLRNAPPFAPTSASAASLKRLVLEVEEKRRSYVKRASTVRALAQAKDGDDEPGLRLPTITQSNEAIQRTE